MKKNIITGLLLASITITCICYTNSHKNLGSNTKVKIATNYIKNQSNNKISTDSQNKQNNTIFNVHLDMDMKKSYDNIDSLKKDAEIIVRGTVLDTKSYMSGPGVITEFKLKVNKAFNDNAKVGDVLTIATAGGTISYEDYSKIASNKENIKDFEKNKPIQNSKNSKVKISIGKNDLIETGKDYIIFANTQPISADKKMYCTLNINEGQFEVTNKKAENKALKYSKNIDNFEKLLN